MYIGPPSAPLNPRIVPQSPASLVLLWKAPNESLCIVNYTINLLSISKENEMYIYSTTTNGTNKTVTDVTQKQSYLFTVAGIDSGSRVGETSASSNVITLDGSLISNKENACNCCG